MRDLIIVFLAICVLRVQKTKQPIYIVELFIQRGIDLHWLNKKMKQRDLIKHNRCLTKRQQAKGSVSTFLDFIHRESAWNRISRTKTSYSCFILNTINFTVKSIESFTILMKGILRSNRDKINIQYAKFHRQVDQA